MNINLDLMGTYKDVEGNEDAHKYWFAPFQSSSYLVTINNKKGSSITNAWLDGTNGVSTTPKTSLLTLLGSTSIINNPTPISNVTANIKAANNLVACVSRYPGGDSYPEVSEFKVNINPSITNFLSTGNGIGGLYVQLNNKSLGYVYGTYTRGSEVSSLNNIAGYVAGTFNLELGTNSEIYIPWVTKNCGKEFGVANVQLTAAEEGAPSTFVEIIYNGGSQANQMTWQDWTWYSEESVMATHTAYVTVGNTQYIGTSYENKNNNTSETYPILYPTNGTWFDKAPAGTFPAVGDASIYGPQPEED